MIRLRNGSAIVTAVELAETDARASALLGRATELEGQVSELGRELRAARTLIHRQQLDLAAAHRALATLRRDTAQAEDAIEVDVEEETTG